MEEEKVCLLADDEGNLFTVKDWNRLFTELSEDEVEDLYVVSKFFHSFEETMIEMEDKGLIESAKDDAEAPLDLIANSLDKITEHLGMEKIKELDEKVKTLFDQGSDNINPSNFMHLN